MPAFTGERNPLSFLRKRGAGCPFSFGTALAPLPSEGGQSCVVLASDSHQWLCPWNFNCLQASSATSPVPKAQSVTAEQGVPVDRWLSAVTVSPWLPFPPADSLFAHHQQPKDLPPPGRGSSLTLALNLDNELQALHSNLAEFTGDNIMAASGTKENLGKDFKQLFQKNWL